MDDDIRYLLLTPGPLTTSKTVKQTMLDDHCTWDDDYNSIVTDIRGRLVQLAGGGDLTSVLMQGSGTFSVESTLGSVVPRDGKVLLVNNGAYGKRLGQICDRLAIPTHVIELPEVEPADAQQIDAALSADDSITHVAVVHCETTTGMLNPVEAIGQVVKQHGRTYIVDAMSSFGGIPMTMDSLQADFLVSSANKCIQGVPGFGFVIARRAELERTAGRARSLSLDLFDQWHEMETKNGKWRYTSPTHVVRAFQQALNELDDEGGVEARHARYCENHRILIQGMQQLGFDPLIPADLRSPIITSFCFPTDPKFEFQSFYNALKAKRFVIYPGKVSVADTFRIGTIGHLFPEDVELLVQAIGTVTEELGLNLCGQP